MMFLHVYLYRDFDAFWYMYIHQVVDVCQFLWNGKGQILVTYFYCVCCYWNTEAVIVNGAP